MSQLNPDALHKLHEKASSMSAEDVARILGVDPGRGLPSGERRSRRREFGANRLREGERRSGLSILLEQFKNVIVALLLAAALVSFFFGEAVEGAAILAVIFLNAGIGFLTEMRAVRSMEALRELSQVSAKIRQEGETRQVAAESLVPGDMLLLDSGDVITADIRLTVANKLQADESALTGESVPVGKQTGEVEAQTPLAERSSMLFKGTAVTRGTGEGIVVATGMDTELGQISSLVEEAEEEVTPLEKRLSRLGEKLVWVTLAIAAAVAVTGILVGRDVVLIMETAIALAVAAVPEGLPIVATIALARGMWRMAHHNALVSQLSAVETLGATTVICTDKTGTLTENEMAVAEIWTAEGRLRLDLQSSSHASSGDLDLSSSRPLEALVETMVLCNNASLGNGANQADAVGDPMEIALLRAGLEAGLDRDSLLERLPEVREVAFDPEIKMMATFHEDNGSYRVAVKGAPEAVLSACSKIRIARGERELDPTGREDWLKRAEEMGDEGLRLLAMASKSVVDKQEEAYTGLTFLGICGLLDPPREDVQGAIKGCMEAGIEVIMVTGDQPVTARRVAQSVHLVEEEDARVTHGRDLERRLGSTARDSQAALQEPIYARVSPRQKLEMVGAFQEQGEIVAMTGDGVNDAPALKKADIGVAMGRRGTQVAREAADMVLKDDAFSTIVTAIEGGRAIFDNIRKFVLYLLSCNVSEIMAVSLASFANIPLPVRPLQILYLNLVTDVFPALALGVGEGDPMLMKRPPRDPEEPILMRSHWGLISLYSAMIGLSVVAALLIAIYVLKMETAQAVTVSFLTLASAQLWHVFNMRGVEAGWLRNDITRNPFVWGALASCGLLLLAAVYLPGLAQLLGTTNPGLRGWTLVTAMSLVPLALGQLLKTLGVGRI